MDQELRGYLKDLSTIQEELPDWNFEEIEKRFQTLHPRMRLAYFHDRAIRDDNVILHLWDDAEVDDWFLIWTNDDPIYYHLNTNVPPIYDSQL